MFSGKTIRRHPASAAAATCARAQSTLAARSPEEVAWAKRVIEEMGDGSGTVMIDGNMQDDATVKQCKVMVSLARLIARRHPEMREAYGFSETDLASA